MSGEFPMFRLLAMLARQVSAPIANRIKEVARGHPRLSHATVQRLARLVYAADLRLRLWSIHAPQPATLPPLSDRTALDYGADILGEAIVFSLGSAILLFEVNRQAMNAENKKADERSAWLAVRLQLQELRLELELQQNDLDRMRHALDHILNPEPDHDRHTSIGAGDQPTEHKLQPPSLIR